jgi:hypothetical protein
MDIRYNINRIDTELKESFDNVEIKEKSSLKFGKYFEIIIRESKDVRIILPYKNIDNKVSFEFLYFSNPINEMSELISRNSDIKNISLVVRDIIDNNRFSEEYIKN